MMIAGVAGREGGTGRKNLPGTRGVVVVMELGKVVLCVDFHEHNVTPWRFDRGRTEAGHRDRPDHAIYWRNIDFQRRPDDLELM